MKLITVITLINFTVLATNTECDTDKGTLNDCLKSSKSKMEACNNQTCQCQAMSSMIDCFSSCQGEERAMEAKADHVDKMNEMCHSQFKATPSQSGNNHKFKLKEATNIAQPTSSYNFQQFPPATDPPNYYATVGVYQSMPAPGSYSNYTGQHNAAIHHHLPTRTTLLALIFALYPLL